jgi:membrane-associated phospholipid phosphatase
MANGEVRWEHFVMLLALPALAFTNVATKRLFVGVFPMALLGLAYDLMRFLDDLGLRSQNVRVCEVREIEMRFFGIELDGARTTVHDWFQRHPSTVVDVLAAIPYGTFLFVAVAFAIWLYRKDYVEMRRFGWAFCLVNLAGFITHAAYPAAAPWYYHAHGCAVDLFTKASAGPNLTRVDALLGIQFFGGLYGRSTDVFGAVPSLHCAYPTLILIHGFRLFRLPGRVAAIAFFVSMTFAAVYLDHHWVIDVVLGVLYASFAALVAKTLIRPPSVETAAAVLPQGVTS